jgi:putative ABC transport system substrate-binding protein
LLLGGAAATWPVGAGGQSAKLRTIGFLGATTASAQKKWTDAFVQRLRELDWIEGRTVAIEYRWTEGRTERAADIFADFVRLKVDIIVTHPTALALAAKQATSLIPIVFALAGDPVGSGLVASLARPSTMRSARALASFARNQRAAVRSNCSLRVAAAAPKR